MFVNSKFWNQNGTLTETLFLFCFQSFSFPGMAAITKCTPPIENSVILKSSYFTCNGVMSVCESCVLSVCVSCVLSVGEP